MSVPNISITLKAFDKIVKLGVSGSVSSADDLPVHLADADATVNISLLSTLIIWMLVIFPIAMCIITLMLGHPKEQL